MKFSSVAPFLCPMVSSIHLLMIGSSVDRYLTNDICNHFDAPVKFWGNDSISYSNSKAKHLPAYCEGSFGHVATVHVFGSRPVGPYLYGLTNDVENQYVNSNVRIQLILQLYQNHFEYTPERVFFSSAIWDCAVHSNKLLTNQSIEWSNITHGFHSDIQTIIAELKRRMGPTVDIGLRTDVWVEDHGELMHEHNRIVRELARVMNLSIYDYDTDVSIRGDHHTLVFRDKIHPREHYQIPAMLKMLGLRYSRCMTFRHIASDFILQQFYASLTTTNEITRTSGVWFIATSDHINSSTTVPPDIFYFNHVSRHRYSNITDAFKNLTYLSINDVLIIDPTLMDRIPSLPLPSNLFQESVFYNYTSESEGKSELWFVFERLRIKIQNNHDMPAIASYIGIDIINFGPAELMFFTLIGKQDDMWLPDPDIFRDTVVMRPKCTREMFLVFNHSRHSIPNMDTFFSLNKTLDDVKVTHCSPLLNFLLPVTEPLPPV